MIEDQKEKDEKKPIQSEEFWFYAAIVSATLMLIAVFIGLMIVLFSGPIGTLGERADPFYKFSIVAAGIVTFCTVVWRGLISTRQADAQLKQIDRLTRQIQSTDVNNLAKLLQDGAQLITDDEHSAKVNAGIATLRSIATSKTDTFEQEAMELLADYVQENYWSIEQEPRFQAACRALQAAAMEGNNTARTLTFDQEKFDFESRNRKWEIVFGVGEIQYIGGQMRNKISIMRHINYPIMKFYGTKLIFVIIDFHQNEFKNCIIENCRIKEISVETISNNKFIKCDFSDARIFGRADNLSLDLEDGNFYIDVPPTIKNGNIDWTEFLHDGDPETMPAARHSAHPSSSPAS